MGQSVEVKAPWGDRATGRVRQVKSVMGDKSVFTRDARERMDVQVFEAFVAFDGEPPDWPHELEVRVVIDVGKGR
jgi:hypothetical protein